jgi:hypothetical protein
MVEIARRLRTYSQVLAPGPCPQACRALLSRDDFVEMNARSAMASWHPHGMPWDDLLMENHH